MATGFQSDAFQTTGFQIDAGSVALTANGLTYGPFTLSQPAFSGGQQLEGGAQFGPIHRVRRKKKPKHEKSKRVTDAIWDALDEIENRAQAARVEAVAEIEAEAPVDLAQAAGDAAYAEAYNASIAEAIAKEQQQAKIIAARLEESRTAIQAAFAKAEQRRLEAEAKAKAEAYAQAKADAQRKAEEAQARFLELQALNDDDEEAIMAVLMALEAA